MSSKISDDAVDTFAQCLSMTGIWGAASHGVMLTLVAYPIFDKDRPQNYATAERTWERGRQFVVQKPNEVLFSSKDAIKQAVIDNIGHLSTSYEGNVGPSHRNYEIGISNRITSIPVPNSLEYMGCWMAMADFAPGLEESEARKAADNTGSGLPFASPIALLNSGNSFHAYAWDTSDVLSEKVSAADTSYSTALANSGAQAKLAGKILLAGDLIDTKWLALGLIRGYNVLRLTHNVKSEIKHVVGT